MPELAEVEVVRTRVAQWWEGKQADDVRLHDPKVLDEDDSAERLKELLKSTVTAVRRRGKYLIVDFGAQDASVIFHFRMTGKITIHDQPKRRFTRLSWLVPDEGWLVFDDARRLGGVTIVEGEPLEVYDPLVRMGPEPHELKDSEHLRECLAGTKRRFKDALLDQSVIAGVGNIAISELFWRVRLTPDVRTHKVSDATLDALVEEMPAYFDWLVEDQMADEIVYLGEGKAENPFDVYDREDEPCHRCDTAIARATFGGRSTYYCPQCQGEVE